MTSAERIPPQARESRPTWDFTGQNLWPLKVTIDAALEIAFKSGRRVMLTYRPTTIVPRITVGYLHLHEDRRETRVELYCCRSEHGAECVAERMTHSRPVYHATYLRQVMVAMATSDPDTVLWESAEVGA